MSEQESTGGLGQKTPPEGGEIRPKRRSVLSEENYKWLGWSWIKGLVEWAEPLGRDTQAFIAITFATGARRAEVVQLKPSMFSFLDSGDIEMNEVPLLKHTERHKLSGIAEVVTTDPHDPLFTPMKLDGKLVWRKRQFKTVRKQLTREQFLIFGSEPLVPFIRDFVKSFEPNQFLFCAWGDSLKYANPWRYWHRIRSKTFPHQLRSQRASCLATEYRMPTDALIKWFSWDAKTGEAMARHYVRQDAEQAFGIYRPNIEFKEQHTPRPAPPVLDIRVLEQPVTRVSGIGEEPFVPSADKQPIYDYSKVRIVKGSELDEVPLV